MVVKARYSTCPAVAARFNESESWMLALAGNRSFFGARLKSGGPSGFSRGEGLPFVNNGIIVQ